MSMRIVPKVIANGLAGLTVLLLTSTHIHAQEAHPLFASDWWANVGVFFSQADLEAEASGSIAGMEESIDFEKAFGVDDKPTLFMGELGWQFTENWAVAFQYFRSGRDGSRVLEETVEWNDDIFEIGAQINGSTDIRIARFFFARRFQDAAGHSLRLGAGFHWLDLEATLSGEARIDDMTTEFRASRAEAELPVPNLGAWYRYSPNDKWLFSARVDWLSASIDKYSGDIWNVSAGVNYAITDRFGFGLNYQYFEISGSIDEDSWRGEVKTTFTGPFLYVSGFW